MDTTKSIDAVEQEKDKIFSLLTYAIVLSDWQPYSIAREKRRGYNIGALLVNPSNEPVHHGLNCINSTHDSTQHGELRTIMAYLNQKKCFDLRGFTIYTTLEPCIMCAGMITMTSIDRVVFGQHDVEYSKAFDRLAIDTSSIGGFPPYPRQVLAHANETQYCTDLDQAYREFYKLEAEKMLARFLTTDVALRIYNQALFDFLNYEVVFQANKKIYENSIIYYNLIK